MLIMLSNHSHAFELAVRYPGRIGHLYSPGESRGPYRELPFALDNGAWASRKRGGFAADRVQWDFMSLCERYVRFTPGSRQPRPRWLAVPDAVGNRQGTLDLWAAWMPKLRRFYSGCPPLAFCVQDGMTAYDVPKEAAVVFVGGSTDWKWESLAYWAARFPRVHVGRVNSPAKLDVCFELEVESLDGTGWMKGTRENPKQYQGLLAHLERTGSWAPAA